MNSIPHLGIYISESEEIPNTLDTFKEVVHAIHSKVESPLGMVFVSALSTAAACTQELADVISPGGGRNPISLYLLVIANSGERKTSTDREFTHCISDFELAKRQHSNQSKASQAAARDVWKSQLNALKKKLEKAASKNDEKYLFNLEGELKKHYESSPSLHLEFRMLFEDATMPALLRELATTCTSAYLNSSEGGILLGRTGGDYLFYLNKLWDGEEIRVDRVKEQNFMVNNVRLSLSAMIQERILLHFLKRKDGFARSSGFLARCLPVAPESTQGHRFNSLSAGQDCKNQDYIEWFHGRANALLNQTAERKNGIRPAISFSPEAAKIWQHFYAQIESELTEHGALADIRDFASKISNNMARIAAVLHLFCGLQGNISAEIAKFSADLCRILIGESKKIFGLEDPIVQSYKNAHNLHKFLYERFSIFPHQGVSKRWLCQHGPCRPSGDFDIAAKILCDQGIAYIEYGARGSYSIHLIPHAFNSLPAPQPLLVPPAEDKWGLLLQTTRSRGSVI